MTDSPFIGSTSKNYDHELWFLNGGVMDVVWRRTAYYSDDDNGWLMYPSKRAGVWEKNNTPHWSGELCGTPPAGVRAFVNIHIHPRRPASRQDNVDVMVERHFD